MNLVVELTKEELASCITNIGNKVDSKRNNQVSIAKSGDVKGVLKLEKEIVILESAYNKLLDAYK